MRRLTRRSYTTYSIGCAVAWGILWIVVGLTASATTQERVLYVFLGWLIGWVSATIARRVYPPPRRR